MNKIIYIADSLYPDSIGGGEINDYELCKGLQKFMEIRKFNSRDVTIEKILDAKDRFIILSNFLMLEKNVYDYILNNERYIIYEHDHKYLKKRNPAFYENYKAPKREIANFKLYSNSKNILCQSEMHKNILLKNIDLKNVINVSGNLWSSDSLKTIEKISQEDKKDCVSILKTNNWHKNMVDAIRYCDAKKMNYELIQDFKYLNFLQKLGRNQKFVFFPKTPETLSRICVEARMMNMHVITNSKVGAAHEEWFKMRGKELINFMRDKRKEILNLVLEIVNE